MGQENGCCNINSGNNIQINVYLCNFYLSWNIYVQHINGERMADILCAEINSWTLITLTHIRTDRQFIILHSNVFIRTFNKGNGALTWRIRLRWASTALFQNRKNCRRFGKTGVSILCIKHHWRYLREEQLCVLNDFGSITILKQTPCSLVEIRRHFRETFCLHLQGKISHATARSKRWSSSRSGCFTSGERDHRSQWTGGWLGPRTDLKTAANRKISYLRGIECRFPGRQAPTLVILSGLSKLLLYTNMEMNVLK
jgi:hypothetical protein